jgi:NAD(P)-dependent dehydrogenase (short-subunit alcohol dehydrogenase family)
VKLALVTGGRRRLGAAIADALAADGWTVARHSHVDDGSGALVADLADASAPARLIRELIDTHGAPPTLLVNNAAIFGQDDAASADAESLARHHAINAQAPVLLALALAKSGSGGAIVNILDQRLRNPNGDQLSYTLSKAALDGATRTLAAALAPHWRVNAVAPGLTIPTGDYDAAQMERLAASMPLGALPTPAAIADAVLYFAGASSVTGQTLFVDGGANLKSYDRDFMHL